MSKEEDILFLFRACKVAEADVRRHFIQRYGNGRVAVLETALRKLVDECERTALAMQDDGWELVALCREATAAQEVLGDNSL